MHNVVSSMGHPFSLIETSIVGDGSAFNREADVFVENLDALCERCEHSHVHGWTYIAVENGQGNRQSRASVRHVDDPRDPSLRWYTREHEVDLFFSVAKFGQVFDTVENSPLVRNGRI